MKVVLNLNKDALIAANQMLQQVYEMPVSMDQRENVYKSIGFDLADKLDKKVKTLIRKANLFDKEKIKLSLKYHEAWALEAILLDRAPLIGNDYQKNLTQALIHTINQQLA